MTNDGSVKKESELLKVASISMRAFFQENSAEMQTKTQWSASAGAWVARFVRWDWVILLCTREALQRGREQFMATVDTVSIVWLTAHWVSVHLWMVTGLRGTCCCLVAGIVSQGWHHDASCLHCISSNCYMIPSALKEKQMICYILSILHSEWLLSIKTMSAVLTPMP